MRESVISSDPVQVPGPEPQLEPDPEHQQLERALQRLLQQLPARPSVALRVAALARDPQVSAGQVARVLATEPALGAQVLRLANSEFFGLARRVTNLDFAVVVIGFNALQSLALRAALEHQQGCPLPGELAGHTNRLALAAALVAPHLQVPVPDALALGMLADLGAQILWQLDPRRFEPLLGLLSGPHEPLLGRQRELYGLDQDQVGARALVAWSLPPEMVQALRQAACPTAPPMVRLAALARQLAQDPAVGWDPHLQLLAGPSLNPPEWELLRRQLDQQQLALSQ